MPYADCPECAESVYVPGPAHVGQQVVCEACGTELAVASVDPLELDWPWDETEDTEEDEQLEG